MARLEADQPLQPSILDRLIDDNPDSLRDPSKSRGQNLAELRQAVRRDLENLLNARQPAMSWRKGQEDLSTSLYNYGIPDFTSANLGADRDRELFRQEIEQTIRRAEPRFQTVSVTMLDVGGTEQLDRSMRFRIDALMYADPAPEPMVFDSILDAATRSFAVVNKLDG